VTKNDVYLPPQTAYSLTSQWCHHWAQHC